MIIDRPPDPREPIFAAEHRVLKHVFPEEVPPTIFHYTKQPAFLEIVNSSAFWATQIQYLNDFSEFSHAVKLAVEELIPLTAHREPIVSAFATATRSALQELDSFPVFVISFSAHGDSLNQWRSYSATGPGYSIGLDTERLKEFTRQNGMYFGSCIYSRERQEAAIRDVVAAYVEELFTYFPYFSAGELNADLSKARAIALSRIISFVGPFFKNSAFEEENEYRVVIPKRGRTVLFRSGHSGIIPFISVAFDPLFKEGLKKIFVKPVPDPDFTARSVRNFLCNKGIDPTEIVVSSTVPYREAP